MNWKVGALALLGLAVAMSAAGQEQGGLILEAADAITVGSFTYQDSEVTISEEFFNPQGSVEYYFPGGNFAIGFLYAQSENNFDLVVDDGETRTDGALDVERTTLLPFVRLGKRDGINLRLGYNMFEYKFSNGTLDETENGMITKQIRDGYAKGDLASGIDAELSLLFGSKFQFGLVLGGTYFMNAKYDWRYRDDLKGGAITTGTAELDAVMLRLAPELSYEVADGWRIFARYQIAGTSWLGNEEDEDEDYAGVDVMTAAYIGLRVDLGL
jgi:hypothetical protein